jgi:hypothetical protein
MGLGSRVQALRSLVIRLLPVGTVIGLVAAGVLAAVLVAPGSLAIDLLFVPVVLGSFSLTLFVLKMWRGERIEEVFLIHRSGLLLTHFSRTIKPEKDRDMIVAMLTALQSFIQETFVKSPTWGLREMDFGEGKLILCRGGMSSLAVLVHGRTPPGLSRCVRRTLANVEATYGEAILEWDGLAEDMAGADDVIAKGLFGGIVRPFLARVRAGLLRIVRSVLHVEELPAEENPTMVPSISVQVDGLYPQEAARALLEQPEIWSVKRQYRALMVTALQQVEEGSFSLPALANIYMTIAMQRNPGPGSHDWWDRVLRTVREVLKSWPWEPSSQSWVVSRNSYRAGDGSRSTEPIRLDPQLR